MPLTPQTGRKHCARPTRGLHVQSARVACTLGLTQHAPPTKCLTNRLDWAAHVHAFDMDL